MTFFVQTTITAAPFYHLTMVHQLYPYLLMVETPQLNHIKIPWTYPQNPTLIPCFFTLTAHLSPLTANRLLAWVPRVAEACGPTPAGRYLTRNAEGRALEVVTNPQYRIDKICICLQICTHKCTNEICTHKCINDIHTHTIYIYIRYRKYLIRYAIYYIV